MNDIAVRVQDLSKRYRIGRARRRHDTLRDALVTGLRAPVDRLRRGGSSCGSSRGRFEDTIWALKDVTFQVQRGEVLGIIGRNGAGKTTLLKILSRITEPTKGRAEIHGRVGSLLEVGTGFHPELTGRENVYLNGAILGMRKAEIDRKFDEIVDFAEIEQFLDTPVKRYSSGMYVRLAFAVAAHLEPEILVVDEVLAVGDVEFQKKCMGRMGKVAQGGRTVLFVSHNMAAIQDLCNRSLLLQDGTLGLVGGVREVIGQYLGEDRLESEVFFENASVTSARIT
jgi:lipopolysaccharide transport system ATP-binding protein